MIAMPDGWKSRIEWFGGVPYFCDADAAKIEHQVKEDMVNEARLNRQLYDDCGDANSTIIAEAYSSDNNLDIIREVAYCPEQIFDWACEVCNRIEKIWEEMDNPQDEEEEDD